MLALPREGRAVTTPAIEMHDVGVRYGRQVAVDGLALRVEPGDIYGFLGPNGAGKTTTIRALLGLVRPQRGRIAVHGADVRRGGKTLRGRIGAHLEGHAFYPYLSGRTNLRVFARYHGTPDAARIDALLDRVGLASAARRRVAGYSLGMRQRLGLAQALLANPDVLVLDEPLNGLDPSGVVELRDQLTRLNREDGMTIFLSSHRLDEVERLCNRVGLVSGGRVVREQRVDALLDDAAEPRLLVRTADDGRASEVLGACAWVDRIEPLPNGLRVALASDAVTRLARALVEAGIDVRELTPIRPTLEDVFERAVAGAGIR